MAKECPDDCQLDRTNFRRNIQELYSMAIPTRYQVGIWGGIGLLFSLVVIGYVWGNTTFSTKTELERAIADRQVQMQEIKTEQKALRRMVDTRLDTIDRKLDVLIER